MVRKAILLLMTGLLGLAILPLTACQSTDTARPSALTGEDRHSADPEPYQQYIRGHRYEP